MATGNIHSSAACGLYGSSPSSIADSSDNANSRIDKPPKSNSSWRSSADIELLGPIGDFAADAFCLLSPRSFSSISTGSGPVYIVLDSFSVEPLALREDAKKEDAEDSVEAKESDDDLGVRPGRCCDVI